MKKIFPTDINLADGYVINIDKPLGWTSTDVVRKVKYALQKCGYRKIKVGHAGTLDPLATGVLLVCVGKATKSVETLQSQEKEYIAEVTLGATTVSGDLEHPIDRSYPYEHITREELEKTLESLCGERLQTPPIYSAKKIEGQRAYEMAREGDKVPVKQALINIYSIELIDFLSPLVRIKVRCSKGTYIRSLAMEIGEKLDTGAHLSALRRTASGGYTAGEACTMEELSEFLDFMKQK